MKRIWIYGILFLVVVAARPRHYELGKLEPVEAVFLYIEDGRIVLETDTGAKGTGDTLEHAVVDMKATTAGIVFLDTADYLLVGEGVENVISEAGKYLKPSTRVCSAESGIKVEDAAVFLTTHLPEMTLKVRSNGGITDKLRVCDGKMWLERK